jgi:hypothetical protein
MQGIIFNALEEFVLEMSGMELWNDVIESSGVSSGGAYTAGKSYEDEEIMALASTLCQRLDVSLEDGLRLFGEFLFQFLLNRGPVELKDYKSSQALLMELESVIHRDVKRVQPHAYTPFFEYIENDKNTGRLIYRSKRKLCFIAEGVIAGLAKHFHQQVKLTHQACMHDGFDECAWDMVFTLSKFAVKTE